jgi:hypothetical protein
MHVPGTEPGERVTGAAPRATSRNLIGLVRICAGAASNDCPRRVQCKILRCGQNWSPVALGSLCRSETRCPHGFGERRTSP